LKKHTVSAENRQRKGDLEETMLEMVLTKMFLARQK